MDGGHIVRILKMGSIALLTVIVFTSSAASMYGEKIPCDDGDGKLTEEEISSAICSYMLEDGGLSLDDVGDAAWVYAYWGGEPKTMTDGFGEEVTFYRPVERIVSAWCTNNELLKVLDSTDKIVAVDSSMTGKSTTLFPEITDLPDCGGWHEPDFEAIISLRPDLYIPWLITTADEEDSYGIMRKRYLEENLLGMPILCIDNNEYRTDEYFMNEVKMLGDILDKQEVAEEFVEFYSDCKDPIIEGTKGLSEDDMPRVWITSLFFSGGEVTASPYAYTVFEPVDLAGGKNIATGLGGHGRNVDLEWVIEQNPEYIFIQIWASGNRKSPYAPDYPVSIAKEQVDEVLDTPELAGVDAIQNRKVYVVQYSHFTKGPARGICTAYLAKLLHPDLFGSLNPQELHQEYVYRFLHIDCDVIGNGASFVYPFEVN